MVELVILLPVLGLVSLMVIMFYYMTRMVEPPDNEIKDPNEVPMWIWMSIGMLIALSIVSMLLTSFL